MRSRIYFHAFIVMDAVVGQNLYTTIEYEVLTTNWAHDLAGL